MSFQLMIGDAATLVRGRSQRIRKDDVQAFRNAHDLLCEAQQERARAQMTAQQVSADAYDAGTRAAQDDMADVIARTVDQLRDDFAAENARRDADMAAGAMAAVRAILGSFSDEELTARLASQAVRHAEAKGEDRGALVLEVASEMAVRLQATWPDADTIRIEPRGDFHPRQITLRTPSGRIVSDIDVQLTNLADRWGVVHDPLDRSDAGAA